ncbi:SMI1/KNR4 family protein [Streptomyces sp. NPDC052415]|uniref:SMI1/KNR4 family protein n=1 Tax=Streptomyces sp. NPDC052415 TaxID=3365690 RepID=UPI0037D4D9EB
MNLNDAQQVHQVWSQLITWLTENAPNNAGALAPGAHPNDIAIAEQAIGRTFPPALATLLGLTNGVNPGPARETRAGAATEGLFLHSDRHLLSTTLIPEVYAYQRQRGTEGGNDDYWQPGWIPFAVDADWLSGLFIDSRTAAVGTWSDYGEIREHAFPDLPAFFDHQLQLMRRLVPEGEHYEIKPLSAHTADDPPGCITDGVIEWD